MKEVTIKTIGWTLFGITFLIMFYGMFIAMSISNMDSEIRTFHTINMDNETKEALIKLSDINSNTKCIVKEYEQIKINNKNYKDSRRLLVNEYVSTNCSIVQ